MQWVDAPPYFPPQPRLFRITQLVLVRYLVNRCAWALLHTAGMTHRWGFAVRVRRVMRGLKAQAGVLPTRLRIFVVQSVVAQAHPVVRSMRRPRFHSAINALRAMKISPSMLLCEHRRNN